jgi:alpha-galactosidase
MKSITFPLLVVAAIHDVGSAAPTSQDEFIDKRLENGLGRTPALGYNNWVCDPLMC